jgi:acyl-CoA thioester hydrolase
VKTLSTTLKFKIRFSEIDAMRVVWHGAYAKYFEDAREYFGQQFDLGYLLIEQEGYFAPIVDLQFQYKQPLRYAMEPEITITYRPTEAAKIVFDYEIRDTATQTVMVTGRSVQVFMDKDYQLVWDTPAFYQAWKERWALI